MKTLEEIFAQTDPKDIINDLKKKESSPPDWGELRKEYEPKEHRIITDKESFPDKKIYNDKGQLERFEPITRISLGLQKLAVNRITQFMFTLPVNTILEDDDEQQAFKEQYRSIKKILKKNRWDSLNKKRCEITSAQCECAVHWYVVPQEEKHKSYGFETPFKVRYAIYSPERGDELYPLFDGSGDMIAFSRQYMATPEGEDKEVPYFECWTADNHYRWFNKQGWQPVEGFPVANIIGKIPIIYTSRKNPVWRDADSGWQDGKVHQIEKLLSENGEIIAYHAAPALVIYGTLKGAPKKGDGNKVFEADDRSKGGAEYVSWQQSPESVKFQFETLLRLYWMEMQLPDLSFENLKGIGAQSGESRKWMLVDSHLKIGKESEIYLDAISREYNIIKAYLGAMNTSWAKTVNEMDLEPEIRPFTVEDEKGKIEILMTANGGKPLISQELSVKLAGLSEDPETDLDKIKEETESERISFIQESAE